MAPIAPPTPAPRAPAQYGREVIRRHALRGVALLVALLVTMLLAGAVLGWTNPLWVFVQLPVLAATLAVDRWLIPRLDRRIRGAEGEEHVGGLLEALADDGWHVLHDVSLGRGNIDHLLVGPGGILTVETKSHPGRRRVADIDPSWLRQSYAQRKLIERVTGHSVDCLLVFSRAYLDRPVSRQRGVLVLPARMLRGHLRRRREILTAHQALDIHRRLALVVA